MLTEWSEIEDQLRTFRDKNGNPVYDIGEIKKELVRGFDFERNTAELRQRQVAGSINTQPHVPIEGVGRCIARIDAGAFHYWGQRETYECWEDRKFVKEFIRDNESVRVNNVPKTASIIRP